MVQTRTLEILQNKYVLEILTLPHISLPRSCHGYQVTQPYLLQIGGPVVIVPQAMFKPAPVLAPKIAQP